MRVCMQQLRVGGGMGGQASWAAGGQRRADGSGRCGDTTVAASAFGACTRERGWPDGTASPRGGRESSRERAVLGTAPEQRRTSSTWEGLCRAFHHRRASSGGETGLGSGQGLVRVPLGGALRRAASLHVLAWGFVWCVVSVCQ
jgi:hypothetical protein